MKLDTEICSLLGIKYPVIQGGMAWVATGELAAAVSEAGGLGIIGAGNAPAKVLAAEIKKVKDRTSRPFGVNVMLLSPFVEEVVNLLCREKVPIITTGAGNPGKYMYMFHNAGSKVIPVVSSVALAKRLERLGVDALIAEGFEAGGHIGELTTMVLVPQVVQAVSVPVIAAGGIADGRGMAAALALGASGVQIGTRFVCAEECTAHSNYKRKIINAGDRDTVVTGNSTGHPIRILKNQLSREFLQKEKSGITLEELEEFGRGRLAAAVRDGDMKYGSIMAGQSAGLVKKEETVLEIIESVVRETLTIINDLHVHHKGDEQLRI